MPALFAILFFFHLSHIIVTPTSHAKDDLTKISDFFKKVLDFLLCIEYTNEVVWCGTQIRSAAIAQSVERILGKDEVASSNLASSSKLRSHLISEFFFTFFIPVEEILSLHGGIFGSIINVGVRW